MEKQGWHDRVHIFTQNNYDFWKLDRKLTRDDNNNNNDNKIFIATRKAQLQVNIHAGLRTQCMYDK